MADGAVVVPVPLGVIGNTPDSGSGESWFDPRRGNSKREARLTRVALLVFSTECHSFCHSFSRHLFDIMRRGAGFRGAACKRFDFFDSKSTNIERGLFGHPGRDPVEIR